MRLRSMVFGTLGLLVAPVIALPLASAGASTRQSEVSQPVGTLLAKLQNPATSKQSDEFGQRVAVSGDTAVVGSPGTNTYTGSAYIYIKRTSKWPTTPTVSLNDPALTQYDAFGEAVSVSGETSIVGAPGVTDAQGKADTPGAAYIYVEGTSGWPATPTVILHDPTTSSNSIFGESVAVANDTAIVTGNGKAYIYSRGQDGWPTTPTATLDDPSDSLGFGWAVSLTSSGSTAVLGYGAGGEPNVVYVYSKGASGWTTTPTATLKNPGSEENSFDRFGLSVAISGTSIAVGAPAQGRPGKEDEGAVYIYDKGTAGWPASPTLTLLDPPSGPDDTFGDSLAISGDVLLVGLDSELDRFHAAYIYERQNAHWPKIPDYVISDPRGTSQTDGFAFSVALSEETALIGRDSQGGLQSGSAFIYKA